MSEEKLYAVRNAKGLYLSMSADTLHRWREGQVDATTSQRIAHDLCTEHGGHVVTLIEEPEKVAVSPEEAELVKNCLLANLQDAFLNNINLLFRGRRPEDITRLKSALTNGYTMAKEKKYGVWVPHVKGKMYYKDGRGSDDLDIASADCLNDKNQQFTLTEIEQYGLQDCEKEEVNDDGMGC
ncbi:DUF1642 domain-containing protein [Lacticaseibacillus paracasei]|uniref:DUF1642 domain-containing protein n=1 Tax=Lacticaseibacillus paracasei TaxID=1597 RepID=UPI00280BD5DC|nr:DUF1642 domain-containing protein [Lacticaseibacillus paracasei]